ncbi:protein Daple-like [Anthonomus grandis grandis]|uniref:protein Daple-like n=1 Tax=Anthonomus grandis grandis TaxID=2921223 RepID=UPI002165A3E5|nr:protein Daple-like [Anthonomus grandis grandis]
MDESSANLSTDHQPDPFTNFSEFEKAFRELTSDLLMKRDEVTKLKFELEQSHHENHNLQQSIDKLKQSLEENKITSEMFMKKSQEFEPKYYEKRDAFRKLEIQYKMELAKNESLKENYQKLIIERSQLIRKIDVLEEKQKRDLIYSSDLPEKMAHLRNSITNIKTDMQNIKGDLHHVTALSKMDDMAQESIQKSQGLRNLIENLKEEKLKLEEECIKSKARCDKIELYVSNNNRLLQEENLEARVLLNQCKKMKTYYKQQNEMKNDLITSLSNSLEEEKNTNLKLIQDSEKQRNIIENFESIVKELKTKLRAYEPEDREDISTVVRTIKIESEDAIEIIVDSQ